MNPLVSKIALRFGATAGTPELTFDAGAVNIIVGPNNSGKSLLLREINDYFREGLPLDRCQILKQIEFAEGATAAAIEDVQTHIQLQGTAGEQPPQGHVFVVKNGESQAVVENPLRSWLSSRGASDPHNFFRLFLKFNTIKLDGPNRIGLVSEREIGDLQGAPKNRLVQLFTNDSARETMRTVIHDALGVYLVLDPTKLGKLRIRLADRPPSNVLEEKGIHPEAVDFHKRALSIAAASDGVKAFCGIMVELYAGDPQVLLIDEPEAFLHPALAFMLGRAVAAKARASGKQLFVSTHSASFLLGCIQSGAPVNVVRLTYSKRVPTSRLLPSSKLTTLMRHPLLRSTGVVNGLFYEGVAVTEGDPDRAFYTEINERLLQHAPNAAARNCLFLNAQNKQTIHQIIRPLRELGIPAAAIVDIDVVKEGGSVWSNLLSACGIASALVQPLGTMRATIKTAFENTGKNMKTEGGIELLSGDDRRVAQELFDTLRAHGIFVVTGGELESWLKSTNVGSGHGPAWLIQAFEALGEDPSAPNYMKPTQGDVWQFIQEVAEWLANPGRKGMILT
ncbi:ATP-dependent nuclease [Oleiharenicola sp. Vm1]|uniref:ATP-dependent nuclease n=1 Tax=Oleiharenicola sp. Vm1 TaxID=3398393 RepID=UPI0039F53D12